MTTNDTAVEPLAITGVTACGVTCECHIGYIVHGMIHFSDGSSSRYHAKRGTDIHIWEPEFAKVLGGDYVTIAREYLQERFPKFGLVFHGGT